MIKIGITGSISSGKTTASKILSLKRGPLFSADKVVRRMYKKSYYKQLLIKKFNIKTKLNLKSSIKKKILKKNSNFKILEKIAHPFVRKEMVKFSKQNLNKKMLFYEIPLLIESKLMNHFNVIIFIKAKKDIRLKRFKLKGGDEKLFNLLDKKQLSDYKKSKFCDHIVDNAKNLKILKKNLISIIKLYE
tara:strand:- start:79 stop:645 length:567 start_codon:yes stop_codon:yes gene_type:complete